MKKFKRQFGGKVSDWVDLYEHSPQWKDGKFQNPEAIKLDFSFQTLPKFMHKQFCDKAGREPSTPIPIKPLDINKLTNSEVTQFIWYGHSVLLIRINNKTIIIDPMMGPNASPIAPFATKRFSDNTLVILDQLPEIDLVLFTHDHYDHLDLDSIDEIKDKCSNFYVAHGTERHLVKWGIEKANIITFNWWNTKSIFGLDITFTPTQHSSGRGISDQSKCLWGGWVIKSDTESIYFSGDGGYNEHFKEIGKRLGPFDIGFMECGQYNENWHPIHMDPEESVQAAIDAGVKKLVPVHWSGFALAQHTWTEPVERFTKEAQKQHLDYITPELGQTFNLTDQLRKEWWLKFV